MVSENKILEMVQQSRGSGKTFAEFIAELFHDKFIEVYVGDSYEDVSTEQISVSYPAVFCGKVVSAYRECLILSCVFVDQSNNLKLGNIMFINERAIRALSEVDGKGIIEDMMLRSKETLAIKDTFIKNA